VTAFARPRWGIRVHAVAKFSALVGDEEEGGEASPTSSFFSA
jgi:hypothetical protein